MITLQQFAGKCRKFGFVTKEKGRFIDLSDRSYACPGYYIAKWLGNSSTGEGYVHMWMRRNNGSEDDPIMEYGVYESARGQWSTMPNNPEVTADLNEFREHLCQFTALLKAKKKQRRRKAIDEL